MTRTHSWLIASLSLLAGLSLAQDRHYLAGIVRDSISQQPISGVTVIVRGKRGGTSTDSLGSFGLSLQDELPCVVVLSHVGYHKLALEIAQNPTIGGPRTVLLRPRVLPVSEVVVTSSALPPLSDRVIQRTSNRISGDEFERLGEPDAERAMKHFLPFIIKPLTERLARDKDDFTLYVNRVWKESMYLDSIDPFTIRQVFVWQALGSSRLDSKHDVFPPGLPLRRGETVILIETN